MATSDKTTTKTTPTDKGAASGKKSARSRRAAQEQQRQRQQQVLLGIVAVVVVAVVIVIIAVAVLPTLGSKSVTVPSEALTRYSDFAGQNMEGLTKDGYPYLGKVDAPHTIEEFASFSCPVCGSYHTTTFVNLLDEIKAGRAKFVFLPVTYTGDYNPQTVTQAGYCAAQQGKFWELQETLYNWQNDYISNTIDPNDTGRLSAAAGQLGMDTAKFGACINSQEAKDFVKTSDDNGNKRGVDATPTIFLDGNKIYPLPQGQPSPDLNQLRGILEANAPAK